MANEQSNTADLLFGDVDSLLDGETHDEGSEEEGLDFSSDDGNASNENEGEVGEEQDTEGESEDVETSSSSEDSDGGEIQPLAKDEDEIKADEVVAATKPEEKPVVKVDPKALIKDKDGKEHNLDATVFIKKIDGKKQEVTLRKALDEYSGKLAVDTRFAEANKIKQKAEVTEKKAYGEVKKTIDIVKEILECTKNNNTRGAVDAMAELTGQDKQRAWEEFSAAQKMLRESLLKLSDQELADLDRKSETLYWKTNAEKALRRKQDEMKVLEKTDTLKKYGLSEDEYKTGENFLLDLQRKGVYNGIISNEAIAYEARNLKIWGQIDAFCRTDLPHKIGKNDFYNEVLKDTLAHGYTQDDWKRLFIELKSQSTKKAKKPAQTSNKGTVSTRPTIGAPKQTSQGTKKTLKLSDMTFNDL